MKHTAIALLLLGLLVEASSIAAVIEGSRQLAARSYNEPRYNSRHDVDADYEDNDQYQSNHQDQKNYQNNQQTTHVQNNIKVENQERAENPDYDRNEYRPRRAKQVARYNAYEGSGNYMSHGGGGYADPYTQLALIPMVGGAWYSSAWGDHISNSYSFGLALEIPLTYYISTEIEAAYSKYYITYGAAPGVGWKHDFNQFSLGGNMKVYLFKGWIRPFVGGGLMAVDYDGMTRGPRYPLAPRYNQWIGSAQLIAGTDFTVSSGVAIGFRGAYLIPVFNRPYTVDNGVIAAPGFEEAAAINTCYYKLMATVKISL